MDTPFMGKNSSQVIQDTQEIYVRSSTDLVVRTIALTAATAAASACLTVLRRQSAKLAKYQVFAILFIPTFPIAECIISAYRTLKAIKRTKSSTPIRYHLCAALDVRASSTDNDEDTVPLCLIPPAELELTRRPYDRRWLAKFVLELILAWYMIFNILLWARRARKGARCLLDDYMAVTALGGLITTFVSLRIILLNGTWHCPEKYVAKFHKHFVEPSLIDLVIEFTLRMTLVELRLGSIIAIPLQVIAFLTTKEITIRKAVDQPACTHGYIEEKHFQVTPTELSWVREPVKV
ncbi:MAG: hypothetical protein Q9164_007920, partial [Protoblastenia rupestris]